MEQGYREAGEVLFETAPHDGEPPRCAFAALRMQAVRHSLQKTEPRLFSLNNPFGACPRCQGFGNTIDFDLNLVIPNKSLTLSEGAIEPSTKPKYRPLATEMRRYARAAGVPLDVPWQDLTPEQQSFIMNGDGKFWGVRGFFVHWSARSTNCTCASSSAVIAAIPSALSAAVCVCGARRGR